MFFIEIGIYLMNLLQIRNLKKDVRSIWLLPVCQEPGEANGGLYPKVKTRFFS